MLSILDLGTGAIAIGHIYDDFCSKGNGLLMRVTKMLDEVTAELGKKRQSGELGMLPVMVTTHSPATSGHVTGFMQRLPDLADEVSHLMLLGRIMW